MILSTTTVALILLIVFYAQEQIKQETRIIDTERIVTMQQIATRTESQFNEAIRLLQIESQDYQLHKEPNISLVNASLNGVSENDEKNIRVLFDKILSTYPDFESVTYVLPSGGLYLQEPYALQETMPSSNFNSTTWFSIVSVTDNPYVNPMNVSPVTRHQVSSVAVPILSENGTITGMIVGKLNLGSIQKRLENEQTYANEKVLIIDNERKIISSDTVDVTNSTIRLNYDSISPSLYGGSGTTTDYIDKTKMFISYYPIYLGAPVWAVVIIQPYDDAFAEVNSSIRESEILVGLVLATSSTSAFLIIRSIRSEQKIRKRLEESNTFLESAKDYVAQSEERYRNLFELSPDAVSVVGKKSEILSFNDAFTKLFGYNEKELKGKKSFDLVAEQSMSDACKYIDKIMKIGFVHNQKLWYKKKDGSLFPGLASTGFIHDKDGQITSRVEVIKDISEIQNLEDKLVSSQRLAGIGELSARVAHDIRNPLSVIKNNFEILQYKDPKFVKKHNDSFERISRAILRINHQVENVLDYVRPTILELKEENINEIIKSVLEKVVIPKGIDLICPQKDISLVCDPLKIEVMLINIITNATQAMGKTGKLDIICTDDEENLVIQVTDTGPGIRPEDISKIFEPLFTTKQVGTGLGLSSCKAIVEKHGGKIDVTSKVGKGTSFIITIPKEPHQETSDIG